MNAPFGYYDAPATAQGRPPVIVLFRIYAVLNALFYLLCAAGMVMMRGERGPSLFLVAMQIVVVAFAVFHAIASAVPFKPWGWALAVAILAIGCVSGMFFFAIPLLVFWLRPECRAAFMRA